MLYLAIAAAGCAFAGVVSTIIYAIHHWNDSQ